MKHYEFIEDDFVHLEIKGHKTEKLVRIVATEDFSVLDGAAVKKGDFGGYISKSSILKGECGHLLTSMKFKSWVSVDSFLADGAEVLEGALIKDNSLVIQQVIDGRVIVSNSDIITTPQEFSSSALNLKNVIRNTTSTSNTFIVDSFLFNQSFSGRDIVIEKANLNTAGKLVIQNGAGSFDGTFYAYRERGGDEVYSRGCFSGTYDDFIKKSLGTHSTMKSIHEEYKHLLEYARIRMERAYNVAGGFFDKEPGGYVIRDEKDALWITARYEKKAGNKRNKTIHYKRRLPLASSEFQSLIYLPEMRQPKAEEGK